ncbi:MAG: beta-lactamase family protein [Candidatus Latescibacteria bacterium]|nr:beta-lactamase family protein [Candidatus Latescibacterota bacterium]
MNALLVTQIEKMAEQKLADYQLPGLALGVVTEEGLLWFGGFGKQNLGRVDSPTEDSLARVASVTKTFTTTAILQLRDESLLNLDDPLMRHIPEFKAATVRAGQLESVTLRRLLTHYSGMATEAPLPGWDALDFPSREAILEGLCDTEIVIDQDSAWKYSNLAFGLLGEVIQRVSGRGYEDYIKTQILDPLGMTSTVFDLDGQLQTCFLTGYNPTSYRDDPVEAPYAHLNGLSAAGQLHSSVSDLAKWVAFQFREAGGEREGEQVLSGKSLCEMHRPQYMTEDWSSGQCLGWRATRIGDHVYYNHGGGIHGFATQVWFNVVYKIGVIQFINMWPPPGGQELVQEVLELLLVDSENQEKQPPPTPQPSPEKYIDLLGLYCAEPGIWVSVEWRAGKLQLVVPDGKAYSLHAPADLLPLIESDTFRVVGGRGAGEKVVFERNGGHVTHYALGAFVFKKFIYAGG